MCNELMGWDFDFGFMNYGALQVPSSSERRMILVFLKLIRQVRNGKTELLTHNIFENVWREGGIVAAFVSEQLNMVAVQQFYPRLLTATRGLLKDMLQNPGDVIGNVRKYVVKSLTETSFFTSF